jgi:hypothetical protein
MPQAGEIYEPSSIPRRVGITQGTADLSATVGTTEKTIDAITVSVVAGKTYSIRYLFHYAFATGGVGDAYYVRIRQGGLAGVQLTYGMADITIVAGGTLTRYVEVEWTASATGSQTFTTTVQRAGTAGTVAIRGAASQPRKLEVRYEE